MEDAVKISGSSLSSDIRKSHMTKPTDDQNNVGILEAQFVDLPDPVSNALVLVRSGPVDCG